ncbi:hypothetical protein AB0A63_39860 [Lentzea sp. NPDC042327]|uniref:hypothetical protein n=1 Tax=Lentzea sp. NPDC042327 TaxID=3154801 RepID=UPI003407A79D
MAEAGPIKRFIESPMLGMIAFSADLLATVPALLSDSPARWVSGNPRTVIFAVSILFLAALVAANGWLWNQSLVKDLEVALRSARDEAKAAAWSNEESHKSELHRLQETHFNERRVQDEQHQYQIRLLKEAQEDELRRLRATHEAEVEALAAGPISQDIARYASFAELFGPDSVLGKWLVEDFVPHMASSVRLDALDRVYRKWNSDPLDYHDPYVAEKFRVLKLRLEEFFVATHANYFPDDRGGKYDGKRYRIPDEWELEGRRDGAIRDVHVSRDNLVQARLEFMKAAHGKRLT